MTKIITFLTLSLTMSAVYAQEQSQGGLLTFLPLILLMVVFYFLLIRPQSKRAKEHKKVLSELKKGDEVATSGGTIGKIQKVDDSFIDLEIAAGIVVKVQKQAVSQRMPKGTVDLKG